VVVVQLFVSLSFVLHYVFYWQCSIYPNDEFMHCILIFVFDFLYDVYLFYLEFILQYPKHNDTTDIFMILYISELMNIFFSYVENVVAFWSQQPTNDGNINVQNIIL
jgi:hypothetical protein